MIELQNVGFAYNTGETVLKDVSFILIEEILYLLSAIAVAEKRHC